MCAITVVITWVGMDGVSGQADTYLALCSTAHSAGSSRRKPWLAPIDYPSRSPDLRIYFPMYGYIFPLYGSRLETYGYVFDTYWIPMDICFGYIWISFGYGLDLFRMYSQAEARPGASPRQQASALQCGRRSRVGQAREVPVGKPVSQSRFKFTRP